MKFNFSNLQGKYQTCGDLEELKKTWAPEAMLPKMYKDKDVGKTIRIEDYYSLNLA